MTELLKLKDKTLHTPIGFVYYDPDTKVTIRFGHFEGLVEACKKHRRANNLPIAENFSAVIEDFICRNSHPSFTIQETTASDHTDYAMTTTLIRQATELALKTWRLTGNKHVAIAEAEHRASICAMCTENMRHSACLSCRGIVKLVLRNTGIVTKYDKELHVCRISAVMNHAMIAMSTDAIQKATPKVMQDRYPTTCWKIQTWSE